MKLWELREVPFRRAWKTPEEVQEWLKNNGYEYIDSGTYSDVFGKGEYIIKVHSPDNTTTAKCLIAYTRLAMRSNNPHFPKIYAIKTYQEREKRTSRYTSGTSRYIIGATRYIIGTERLYPVEDSKIRIPKNVNEKEFFSFLSSALDLWHLSPLSIPTGIQNIDRLANKYQAENSDDPLIEAYNMIKSLATRYTTCFLDYSFDNIMMRKDGTLVLSDPIADSR